MTGEVTLIAQTAAVAVLEQALGRWFLGSDASRHQLQALSGRTIALRVDPPGFTAYLLPTPEGLQIQMESGSTPHATLTGSLPAFARLGLGRSPHQALAAGDIRIDGNTDVADALRKLFSGASREWRERVSSLLGPIVAGHVAGVTDAARVWAERTATTVREDVTEFLQEEVREVPAPAEGEAFLSGVDRLREDCDRLEARLMRLRNANASAPASHD
ncbi:ubiquinone biosynthesis accessory factor UbiJ [Methylolobus aquaticus]